MLLRSSDALRIALQTRIGGKAPKAREERAPREDHHSNSSAAMEEVHRLWAVHERSRRKAADLTASRQWNWKEALKKPRPPAKARETRDWKPSLEVKPLVKEKAAREWMAKATVAMNQKQKEVVEMHVRRVFEEWEDEFKHRLVTARPFLHLVHGPPGTGKSTVIKTVLAFFSEVVGWQMHREYTVGALQAVVATQLGGETLHHIAGIPAVRSKTRSAQHGAGCDGKTSGKFSSLRFLIIDEVFMLSSKFFAEVEQAISRKTSEASFFRRSPDGMSYSFGGSNVTLVGDMYQLDPPDNSFPLYSIPHSLVSEAAQTKKHPLVTHALEIMWGHGEQSISGMTELDEPYRCRDPWWNEARK